MSLHHLKSWIVWEATPSSDAPSLVLEPVVHLNKISTTSSCDLWSVSGTAYGVCVYVSLNETGTFFF